MPMAAMFKRNSPENEMFDFLKKNSADQDSFKPLHETESFEKKDSLSSTDSESGEFVGKKFVSPPPSSSLGLGSNISTRDDSKLKYAHIGVKLSEDINKSIDDDNISTPSIVTDRSKQSRNVDFGDSTDRRFQISDADQFEVKIMDEKLHERYEEEEEQERSKPRRIKPVCCGIVQSPKSKKK